MRHFVKKALALALAALLAAGCCSAAFAAVYTVSGGLPVQVTEKTEIARLVTFFNDSVNVIKTETPRAKVTYRNYVPQGGMTAGGRAAADEMDNKVQKYVIPVLEGLFNGRSSVAKSFIQTLLGTQQNVTLDTLELHRGMLRNNTVPVYGRDYVSVLAPAEDYEFYADMSGGGKNPSRISLNFPERSLEEAQKTSPAAVFSLPSGSFDPAIFSGARTEYASRLDNAKFTYFNIKKAKLVTQYDGSGLISYYGSTIEYDFAISFYDCMNLISAVLGYDFYSAVIEAINPILESLAQDGVSKESVLQDRQIYITYCCDVEIGDFDFTPRLFGDINDDGRVTSSDARDALRHAVKLESIRSSDDRIYADVNFDGVINSADARLILRMAVGLEELFTEVPPGKKILIVKVEEEPPAPETPQEPQQGDEPGGGLAGLFDNYDPAFTIADVVKGVLAYIGMANDTEGDVRNYIQEFIEAIQSAVKDDGGENSP